MSEQPTAEEIKRVREWECVVDGHRFEVMTIEQGDGPHLVVCSNCGASWRVRGDEDAA